MVRLHVVEDPGGEDAIERSLLERQVEGIGLSDLDRIRQAAEPLGDGASGRGHLGRVVVGQDESSGRTRS